MNSQSDDPTSDSENNIPVYPEETNPSTQENANVSIPEEVKPPITENVNPSMPENVSPVSPEDTTPAIPEEVKPPIIENTNPSIQENVNPVPPENTNPAISENSKSVESVGGWDINFLLRTAIMRFKERAISYFLASFLFYGITMTIFFGFIMYIGFALAFIMEVKDTAFVVVAVIISVILGILGLFIVLYLFSLTQLILTKIIIQEPKKKIGETFHDVKSYAWGYVWVNILVGLFLFGLLPLGFVTIFIIYIFWGIWGSFLVYVYLDHQKRGLDNLWLSKAIVSQRFWGIFGRIMVLYGVLILIVFILASIFGDAGNLFGSILGWIFAPFLISYIYQMYKQLPVPTEAKTPKVWMILSVLGGIVMVLMAILGIGSIIEEFEKVVNTAPVKEVIQNDLQNPPIVSPPFE